VISIDTNVFVRLLVRDGDAMTRQARSFVAINECHVPTTVILETAWILASAFDFSKQQIVEAFEKAVGLPNLEFENGDALVTSLEWMRQGLEIEDAMHLASTPPAYRFATFDKDLARRAKKLSVSTTIDFLRVHP
jgi:predicted nucleic acid-binding protein